MTPPQRVWRGQTPVWPVEKQQSCASAKGARVQPFMSNMLRGELLQICIGSSQIHVFICNTCFGIIEEYTAGYANAIQICRTVGRCQIR